MTEDALHLSLSITFSRIKSFFSKPEHLHTASLAGLHELKSLLSHDLDGSSLLLAESPFNHLLRVAPTQTCRELGNLLVVARTRGGKGLLASAQLLTWGRSAVVNDIKGELFAQTAGYRAKIGKVYCIDPTGIGHRYDPFKGRVTQDRLYSSAKHLLFDHKESNGIIFTQRATKMLTQLFLAARLENCHLLPYLREILSLGLKGAARRLQALSPILATAFLDGVYEEAHFEDDRFLLSSWGTLSSRLFPLLTDNAIRSFSGSGFTPERLLVSRTPITVYLRWPEADLLSLSPLVRLVWESLIHSLISFYDKHQGANCHPLLLVMDEAARSAIPSLPEYASTVCGRGIIPSDFCAIPLPA